MLVLTRKVGQQINIGQGITITVVRIRGGSIRLGIDAPPNTHILRGELTPFDSEEPASESTPVTAPAAAAPATRAQAPRHRLPEARDRYGMTAARRRPMGAGGAVEFSSPVRRQTSMSAGSLRGMALRG